MNGGSPYQSERQENGYLSPDIHEELSERIKRLQELVRNLMETSPYQEEIEKEMESQRRKFLDHLNFI